MGIQINGNTNNINAGIGSLSIEDLKELDIVGVATASNFKTGISNLHNLGLTLSGGQLDVGSNIKIGNAGVITATSFVGDGSNLTGLSATSDKIEEGNSSVEVIDSGTGKVDVITDNAYVARFGQENGNRTYMIIGNGVAVSNDYGTNTGNVIIASNTTTRTATLRLFTTAIGAADDTVTGIIDFAAQQAGTGGQTVSKIENSQRGGVENKSDLIFSTSNAGSPTEKLRILANGNIGIGTDNPQYLDAGFRELTISGGSEGAGLHLQDDNANVVGGFFTSDNTNAMIIRTRTNHPMMFRTNNTQRFRIETNGNATIIDGDLVIGTSGHGVDFSATGDSAGNQGSSELLDDYEEGSWTPAFKAGNNSTACPTSVNEAKYTKVGRLVTATAYFTLSSYASGGTGGDTRIVGLPYQNIGDHGSVQINYWWSLKQNISFMAGTVQGGTSEILIRATTSDDTGTQNIDFDNTFGPSDSLILTATYHTS